MEFRFFLIRQEYQIFDQLFYRLVVLPFPEILLIDLIADPAVDFRAGDIREDSRTVIRGSLQEGVKTSLRQQNALGELFLVQTDQFCYAFLEFRFPLAISLLLQ